MTSSTLNGSVIETLLPNKPRGVQRVVAILMACLLILGLDLALELKNSFLNK